MNAENITNSLFWEHMDKDKTIAKVQETLKGCHDGELFLEHRYSENITLDESRIKSTSYNVSSGFGLRAVCDDTFAYAISNDLTDTALSEASKSVAPIKNGNENRTLYLPPLKPAKALYTDTNPLTLIPFEQKVALMNAIDVYIRTKEPRIVQVSASLFGEWQAVKIIQAKGRETQDIRPMVGLTISVIAKQADRMETGSFRIGGRYLYDKVIDEALWQAGANEAIQQALTGLESIHAPTGEMPVVLGNGWGGVLLHEAVGHGLEGDFNRKETSVFTGKIGEQVTAKGITIIDDGSIPDRRGSLSIDDEGTTTQRNVLVEDGILKGYMFDRLNARLMNQAPTGNGRRESYAYAPTVRMTNTFMDSGDKEPEELIASVKKGVYAKSFHGGQVDITSGKFVFETADAYLIEDGKITAPIKDATLIGSGIEVMNKIDMIAKDSCLDNGTGTCGKSGQSAPVGVGQPSLRISSITVGGNG